MALETTLTSKIWNPFDGSTYADTDKIEFDYSTLGFTPSAGDSYKSTSGDVFKVYVGGVRIYRTDDSNYASGTGFLEDGDTATALNGVSATWSDTSNTVWEIDTANQLIKVDTGNILATNLYKNSGIYPSGAGNSNLTFTDSTIIEVRRSLQNENSPSVDFSNASILTEQDLDNSSLNVFHMAQQAVETANLALPYNTGTGLYEAYQPGTTTKKKITQVADGTATNDAVNKGQLSATETTTLAYKEDTEDYKLEAADWATKVNGVVNTYTDNVAQSDGTDQSAKAYAIGGTGVTQTASKGAAKEWAIGTGRIDDQSSGDYSSKEWATGTTATSSKTYATKVDGAVTGTDFSSKAWAVGGTNVTTTASRGSAKEWATASGLVDTASYSAKEYSQSTTAGTSTYGGSAKGWASTAYGDAVPGAGANDRSAKHYSTDASNSATSAANSAAAVSQTYDNFSDVYLGSMRTDKTVADAVTLTGASWSKDSSSIAFTGISSGTVTIGQELTSTGSGYPVGANIIGSQTTTPLVISNPFTVAGTGATLVFVGSGVNGAFNSSTGGPAANNDGDALVNGNLYFNSQENEMRIFDGANWIAATAVGQTSLLEYKYVTTSAQVSSKTYSGAADVGGTLSYTQSNIIVFMNGVQLKDTTDYTATNGSSVVLVNAPVLNDEINVIAFKSFTTADMVSKSNGGTFASAVTFGAGLTSTTGTFSGAITANGGIETDTNSKVIQKGAFMQSSTHQALTLGG